MTEETQEEDLPDQLTNNPTPHTFVVTVTRQFEMDMMPQQAAAIAEQLGEETPEAALAEQFAEQEAAQVEATQKLLGLDVDVDGPSDD
jgi:hypothetical protein